MSKRNRFKRSAVASSRGPYVRKSHFLYIQECLKARGIYAPLEDIIEISITIKVKTNYAVKCFGQTIVISEEEAMKLNPELIIKF